MLMEGLLLTSNSSFFLKVVITDHRPPPHTHINTHTQTNTHRGGSSVEPAGGWGGCQSTDRITQLQRLTQQQSHGNTLLNGTSRPETTFNMVQTEKKNLPAAVIQVTVLGRRSRSGSDPPTTPVRSCLQRGSHRSSEGRGHLGQEEGGARLVHPSSSRQCV